MSDSSITRDNAERDERPRYKNWMIWVGGLLALIALIGLAWWYFGFNALGATLTKPACVVKVEKGGHLWLTPGGKPLVERKGSPEERLKKAQAFDRCSMEAAGIPEPVIAALLAKMSEAGSHVSIQDGVHYDFVSHQGPALSKSVTTRFGRHVRHDDPKRGATEYTATVDGETWIADRFDWCMNLGVRHGHHVWHKPHVYHPRPPTRHPAPPIRHAANGCFLIRLGGYDTSVLQTPARVTWHAWVGSADTWNAIIHNPCSQVNDGHTTRPLINFLTENICGEGCDRGAIMADTPDDVPDDQYREHFGTAFFVIYGSGYLSLPADANLIARPMQFCAKTLRTYHGPGGEERRDCYDNVSWSEINDALNAGRKELPRTVAANFCPGRTGNED